MNFTLHSMLRSTVLSVLLMLRSVASVPVWM